MGFNILFLLVSNTHRAPSKSPEENLMLQGGRMQTQQGTWERQGAAATPAAQNELCTEHNVWKQSLW